MKSFNEIPRNERLLILSTSPIFRGLREKKVIVKPEEVMGEKMSKWSNRYADSN